MSEGDSPNTRRPVGNREPAKLPETMIGDDAGDVGFGRFGAQECAPGGGAFVAT